MDLETYIEGRRSRVENALEQLLPSESKPPRRLIQAMRYSLLSSGKRLRPILLLAAAEAVGPHLATGSPESERLSDRAMPFACAMECIHTYSLIHDDLPAMDDDDLRRGRPTCHKQFDEATAILAGDALLTLAFDIASQPREDLDPAVTLTILNRLARDAGLLGMVGGQMMDLEAEGRTLTLPELQAVHVHKTGALIRAACVIGGLLGGGLPQAISHLDRYGKALGLAFQIIDDLLDEVGDSTVMGKMAGQDRKRGKSTYPRLLGIPQARQDAASLIDEALLALADFGPQAAPLRHLAHFTLNRVS